MNKIILTVLIALVLSSSGGCKKIERHQVQARVIVCYLGDRGALIAICEDIVTKERFKIYPEVVYPDNTIITVTR